MNLIYDPTTTALRELVATADPKLFAHNIALDYDGEVIIDPELRFPEVDVRRYKFCTTVKNESLKNMRKLQALHAALVASFKDTMHNIGGRSDLNLAA